MLINYVYFILCNSACILVTKMSEKNCISRQKKLYFKKALSSKNIDFSASCEKSKIV